MGDPHGGGENDGDILQSHLVHLLVSDHVAHVDEDPLDQQSVTVREFSQQFDHSVPPVRVDFELRNLLEPGGQSEGEDGLWEIYQSINSTGDITRTLTRQLPEEELEKAGHNSRLVAGQLHGLPAVIGGLQLGDL